MLVKLESNIVEKEVSVVFPTPFGQAASLGSSLFIVLVVLGLLLLNNLSFLNSLVHSSGECSW